MSKYNRAYEVLRRRKQRASGLCRNGPHPSRPGMVLCFRCAIEARTVARKREERKAAETPEEQRDVEERLAALIRSGYQKAETA